MVDHLKVVILDLDEVARVWSNPKLIFYSHNETLNHMDWETIRTRDKKFYKGILFCKFDHKLEVLFSPHYYRNADVHNADDFTALDCIQTINSLIEVFKIDDEEKWQIINMEYGLNFVMPNYGRDLVTFTEYWKKTPFYNDTELAYSKKSYSVKRNGTANTFKIIKMYCKSSQFPNHCEPNTVRIEIKSKQSRYINSIGIKHIGHLLELSIYHRMKGEILQLSKDLLILDHKTKFTNLDIRQTRKLKDYLNSHTWYSSLQKNANEFYKKKMRYFDLLNKTGRNIHVDLQSLIAEKIENLCTGKIEKGLNSTALLRTEKGLNSTNNIIGISTLLAIPRKYCIITKRKLHSKDVGSPYARTSTLKCLQKENPQEFEKLKTTLIPENKKRKPKYEQSIIAWLAKQIRNRYYNSKRKKKRESPKLGSQPTSRQRKLSKAYGM